MIKSFQISLSNKRQAYQNTKISKEQLGSTTKNQNNESLSIASELSQKYDSVVQKQDTSFQIKNTGKDREQVLSSSLICDIKDDQNSDIFVGNDSKVTINSVKSFQTIFSPFRQKFDKNYKQQQISQHVAQSQDKESNLKEKNMLNIKGGFNSDCNEVTQTNTPTSQKAETNSSKQSSNKKVTFSDLIQDDKIGITLTNDHQSISSTSHFLQQSHSETLKDCTERSKSASKSILKRSQASQEKACKNNNQHDTFEKNREFQNESQRHQFNMDFISLNRECILEIRNDNTKQEEQCFFSEEVIKISSSGDIKKRMIIITQNLFYVFQDLSSNQHIQRFELSEISKIIVSSHLKNVCSIIVRNTYQLNLQITQFGEFIQFIQTTFQRSLKIMIPIVFYQNKEINDQSKMQQSNNSETKMEQLLNSQKTGFRVNIEQITTSDVEDENLQIQGLIYFFSNKIWLTGLNKQELIEISLKHKNLLNKCFLFEPQKNQLVKFQIKLSDDFDFPLFLNKLNYFQDRQTNNNQSDLLK